MVTLLQVALEKVFNFAVSNIFETRVSGRMVADLCRAAVKVKIKTVFFCPKYSQLPITPTLFRLQGHCYMSDITPIAKSSPSGGLIMEGYGHLCTLCRFFFVCSFASSMQN